LRRDIFDEWVAKKADIIRQLEKTGRATGSILDAGCGTVENASDFVWRGCKVMGIDFLEAPISSGGTGNAEF
jgi:SAM-dependent methyltransferase